jgi:flagellar protein FlgJ
MELLKREDWVKRYWNEAVAATKGTKIFPETMLAMAVVESSGKAKDGNWYPGFGLLAQKANNYFGIKSSTGWKGATVALPTPGDADKISTFRVYPGLKESIADFVNFLQRNPRYENAGVFDSPDYVSQIVAIAKAGYAENPNYANMVSKIANSIKGWTKDIAKEIENNSRNIIPFLFAGALIGIFFLQHKMKS